MGTETMKAFVITAPRTSGVQTTKRWVPEAGEILVRSKAVAICTMERRLFSGSLPHYPAIGGHELAGIVEWVDSSQSELKAGDHVAVDVMNRCGRCFYCLKGSNNLCVDMSKPRKGSDFVIVGGGFAEYVCVPFQQAAKLPDDVDLAEASLIEPLACCLHSISRTQLSPNDTVAVLGAGTMGTLHVLLAKLEGARTIVSDVDEARLSFVQTQGADLTVNPRIDDPVQFVRDCTEGRGADVVVVAAGFLEAGEQALAMVARTGHVILYASLHPSAALQLDWNAVHYREITVTGSANNTDRDFRQAAALVGSRAVNLKPLISKLISLDELPRELMCSPAGKTQRVVVRM
ncbi:MAG: alcohol dehydrogenase catalytic domain-containing protein [Candidatus Korobacteraceae bacterium]